MLANSNEYNEYIKTQANAPAWFFLLVWIGWVAATIAGYMLGQWLSEAVAAGLLSGAVAQRVLSIEGNVQAAGAISYGIALLSGLAAGVALGVAQGLFLLPFLKVAGALEWLAATVLGRTVQWVVIYAIGLETLRLVVDKDAAGIFMLFLLLAVSGLLSGVALGYPQSQVFKRRSYRARLWVFVSTLGPVVTSLVIGMTLFIEEQNTIRNGTTLLTAILAALATGFALLEVLHHPQSTAEWSHLLVWKRAGRATIPAEDTILGSNLYGSKPEYPLQDHHQE